MKNLKKLNRKQLQTLQGAGSLTCIGCPKNTTYGNNPGDASCEAFNMLPDRCKMCVIVDMSCMSGGVS